MSEYSKTIEANAASARAMCDHKWDPMGCERQTSMQVRALFCCENCSSWTYRELDFVGWRLLSLEDKLDIPIGEATK